MIKPLSTTQNPPEVNGHDTSSQPIAKALKTCRILLVEDNPLEARLFQRALTDAWARSRVQLKFEIVHAERLSRACQLLETHSIDIILLDATLPDATGPETIDLIREAAADIPVILMTGLDDAGVVAEAIRRGAHDCLVKSRYDGVHIARTIGHAVERHQLQSQIDRQAGEINRHENNFQNIVAVARDGMVILNEEEAVCFLNPMAEMLLGKSEGELLAQPFDYAVNLDQSVEIDLVRNGQERTLEMSAVEIDWMGKPSRLITLRDITEQKRLFNEKALLERRLLESQRLESLGIMASSIVHDFNNLLTAIMGSAGAARIEVPDTSPLQEDLREIENSCQRAADICKQMLAYSGSKSAAAVQPIDLNSLVRETSSLLQHSVSKRAAIDHKFHKELPSVLGDQTQLRQIIMNLVINASEAIGKKNGAIRITTTQSNLTDDVLRKEGRGHSNLKAGQYVCLEVTDNGCGMPPEVMKKIFDPFFSTKNTGRGVGLCAVAQIVKQHNGLITVSSQPNQGTTFRLHLPCAGERKVKLPETATESAKAWKGHGTVLVVDDELGVRTAIARILKHLGFDTIIACDGRDALVKFRAHIDIIECVLMDLTMPQLDGKEACSEILKIKPKVPILLMSGFSAEEACQRFADTGISGFLQKPFDHTKLTKAFRAILEDKAESCAP